MRACVLWVRMLRARACVTGCLFWFTAGQIHFICAAGLALNPAAAGARTLQGGPPHERRKRQRPRRRMAPLGRYQRRPTLLVIFSFRCWAGGSGAKHRADGAKAAELSPAAAAAHERASPHARRWLSGSDLEAEPALQSGGAYLLDDLRPRRAVLVVPKVRLLSVHTLQQHAEDHAVGIDGACDDFHSEARCGSRRCACLFDTSERVPCRQTGECVFAGSPFREIRGVDVGRVPWLADFMKMRRIICRGFVFPTKRICLKRIDVFYEWNRLACLIAMQAVGPLNRGFAECVL